MSPYTRVCAGCSDTKPLAQFPRRGAGRSSRCRDCETARRRKRTRTSRSKDRASRLLREYGITSEEYARMGRAQRWRCAVCGRRPRPQDGRLVVDHDHRTGAVRALLCAPCNSALGLFGDKPERLRAAAAYLDAHSSDSRA